MNTIVKAIAVSLSTFITANATTVVHPGEENKYYGFDIKKQGNTYMIKNVYTIPSAHDKVILDVPGQINGQQVELVPKSFYKFGRFLTSISEKDMVREYEIQAFERLQVKKNYEVLLRRFNSKHHG